MEKLIKKIISQKIPCHFISPHLDDAFLSAGDLISYLSSYTNVTIITIFTAPSPKPYSLAAKRYLRYCGYEDADALFRERKDEDKIVCAKAGVSTIHLDFVDGTWRKKRKPNSVERILGEKFPGLLHTYPLGRTVIGLSHEDTVLKKEIKAKIQAIATEKKYVVFCPLGTVKHMDHTITRQVCMETFPDIIFWSDFPYITTAKKQHLEKNTPMQQMIWNKHTNKKKELIQEYKTQLSTLFPGGKIILRPEIYYYK